MGKRYDCAIILPALAEKHLDWTVKNIIRTHGSVSARIMVIYDGQQAKPNRVRPHTADGIEIEEHTISNGGTGRSRDFGIEKCREPVCILLDAHMDFSNGWLEQMVDYTRLHPTHVSCTVSEVMREGNPPEPQGRYYYGASIVPLGRDRKTGTVKNVLAARWKHGLHSEQNVTTRKGPARYDYARNHLPDSVELIECPLGGCYAVSREWYLDGLNRPWRAHMTWGTAEPTIAIPNWLRGGEAVLLPVCTGHLYYTNSEAAQKRPVSTRHVQSNQLRLSRMIPMPAPWRSAFDRHMTSIVGHRLPDVERLVDMEWTDAYRSWLSANVVRTWADYTNYWRWEDITK